MRKTLLVALFFIILAPVAEGRSRAVAHRGMGWQAPRCTEVKGLSWIRFFDTDKTIRASVEPPKPWPNPLNTTEALAIGATPNLMWAVTYYGAIHRSLDAGCTWSVAADGIEVLAGQRHPNILARHVEPVYFHTVVKMARLWRDGRVESFTFPETFVVGVAVDPGNALRLRAVGVSGVVYQSDDGGAAWTRRGSAGPAELHAARVDPANFDRMYAAPRASGLLFSNDGGVTWTPLAPFTTVRVSDVFFSPADAKAVWVDGWDTGEKASGLYRSNDAGRTFTRVAVRTTALYFTSGIFALHPQEPDTYALEAYPGIKVMALDGLRAYHWEEGRVPVWSPAGTLYYLLDPILW
ncbi:MAG TPA: hypothetical protein VF883_20720 [Thermoanaerobaculia bacterium]|jgi:hypothetical protein